MTSMDSFKKSFPFIILLFLLLIIYLSFMFIRKGLQPLELLKEGTKRVGQKDFKTIVQINSNDEFEDLGNSFNDMTFKIDQQFQALSVLREIDRSILSSVDSSKTLGIALLKMKKFFQSDISIFIKRANVSSKTHYKAYVMEGRRTSDTQVSFLSIEDEQGSGFLDRLGVDDLAGMDLVPRPVVQLGSFEIASFYCMPVSVKNQITGAILLGWRNETSLDEDALDQAKQITDQISIGLSNSKLIEDLEKLAMGTIEALARTVDAKSKWTAGHSERVAMLSGQIANAMGLDKNLGESLIRGGLLHDIGKIGTPLSILDKPARLSEEEFAEIKHHPEIGAKILEPIEAYQDIIPVVVQHHEKFDGSGYPLCLKGEEIDIRARILAVADVWDALVSDRPYRTGWVDERAKKIIIEGRGSHFDPEVVDIFLAVVEENVAVAG